MDRHDDRDASVGELVQQLSQQTATLVRQEMKLAQEEMKEKGKKAGIGAGLFGAGAIVALGGFGALVAGLVLALAEAGLDSWAAALIVAGGLFAVAGLMALGGKKEVAAAVPPKPEAAIENVQRDVAEVKARAARA